MGRRSRRCCEHWTVVLPRLQADLLAGTYLPGVIRRAYIPKAGGGERGLGIPDVIDRVVQEAVRRVLEPLWEPTFHPSSHGFRPGRSCHTAIAEAQRHLEDGYEWCVDLDLEKFFVPSSHCRRVHAVVAKRAFSACGTGLRRPFWRPLRTWMASSSPRFTRCNTVWRETPRIRIASSDRHVAGWRVFDEQCASWSLTRIRQGAPGVSCSPRMNPSCSQRKSVEAATPS